MQRDEAYLLDILIAARKALRFLEGMSWEDFQQSELHQDAHPEIPWEEMIGMRNRLIHEYFRVNLKAVWDTVHNDLPSLIALIEPLVPPEDEV